ncbi:MAG: hypothetical protein WAV46_03590 [Candidatus Moraniibacteriota bacterium]
MKQNPLPAYKEGQFVCVLLPSAKGDIPDRWYFGRIAKIHPKKSGITEETLEVYQYGVPDTYPASDKAPLWQSLYPSVPLTHEVIMLARLAAKIVPQECDRFSRPAVVSLKDVCPARFEPFRECLTTRFASWR